MISRLARVGRLWRTLRWLKREQLFGRLRLHLRRARPDFSPSPALRRQFGPWVAPAEREPSLIGPSRWRFLSEEHDLTDVGWDDPTIPLLWRYNQHYFDDLNASESKSRQQWQRSLVQRWCNDNNMPNGTAWAPYPTSLRVVNLVKWFLSGAMPEAAWLHSLATQVRWLSQHLEWHLLGNHLFANAKALVFAGLFFEGEEAERWLESGVQILRRELPEQILEDGGQFELSPMYHALALEDVLDLLNVIEALATTESEAKTFQQALQMRANAMLPWLLCMTHSNGVLARFNDCATGIAPNVEQLLRYAERMSLQTRGPGSQAIIHLKDSGYIRIANGVAVALLDAAPIGPDYLPGHAHADTLSFELSIDGREVVVNRGTSIYGDGPRRQWERGTAAHSTVQIDGHNSSEVWAGFRVGRRAKATVVRAEPGFVHACHLGYVHLPGSPVHHRRWALDSTGLAVDDQLDATAFNFSAISRIHLHPDLAIEQIDPTTWRISVGAEIIARLHVVTGTVSVKPTLHALRFGDCVEAQSIEIRLQEGRAAFRIAWDH